MATPTNTVTLLSRLAYAAKKSRVSILWAEPLTPNGIDLLAKLYDLGVLQHIEREAGGFRLFLKYVAGRPAARIHPFVNTGRGRHYASCKIMEEIAAHNGGSTFLISTDRGILTHHECLAQRCGGYILTAVLFTAVKWGSPRALSSSSCLDFSECKGFSRMGPFGAAEGGPWAQAQFYGVTIFA